MHKFICCLYRSFLGYQSREFRSEIIIARSPNYNRKERLGSLFDIFHRQAFLQQF